MGLLPVFGAKTINHILIFVPVIESSLDIQLQIAVDFNKLDCEVQG
jgi:hypothetical protein